MYGHPLLHDLFAGALNVLRCLFGVDFLEDLQHFPRYLVEVDVFVVEDVDLVDVVLLHLSQLVELLQLAVAGLLQHCNPAQVFLLYLFEF